MKHEENIFFKIALNINLTLILWFINKILFYFFNEETSAYFILLSFLESSFGKNSSTQSLQYIP